MPPWFSNANTQLSGKFLPPEECAKFQEEATILYGKYYPALEISSDIFSKIMRSESVATREWISAALRSSTGQDRIFATAYLINTYPMHSLRHLDSLISLISPAKQRYCIRTIDVVYQLFERALLPKQRQLIPFALRPMNSSKLTKSDREECLCLWLFEDELKARYLRFIKTLERLLMTDTVESFKRKSLNVLGELALNFSENRELILGIIINKLGDRSRVFASSVIHKLRTIIAKRPQLTDVVIQEVRSFLFRPNLLERAKYYAIVFLSCMQLRKDTSKSASGKANSDIAVSLIKVYSAFFHLAVKSEEVPEKLVTVLLNGLSRAAPYVPEDRFVELLQEINDIFRLVHTSSFNVSLQALAVLFQLTLHRTEIRDRYYQALYRKLRDSNLLHSSHGPTLLHLLFRSMLADADVERTAAYAQRLLQLCLLHPEPGFVVGVLILLSKVQATKKQIIVSSQTSILSQTDHPDSKDSDDEDERFEDASESDSDIPVPSPKVPPPLSQSSEPSVTSWDHRQLSSSRGSRKATTKIRGTSYSFMTYNPNAREPLFARAGGYPSWPLVLLTSHAHPTVSLFAKQLLQQEPVVYTGNPFSDFSSLHFLDRFAYKKPKASKKSKSAVPPGRVLQRQEGVGSGSRAFPVNSVAFRQLSADRVAADEQFFHTYFNFLDSHVGIKPKKRSTTAEESDQSVSDDEFDKYLEKYEKGLIPTADELDDGGDDGTFDEVEDFSGPSSEDDAEPDAADEAAFALMDGVTSSVSHGRRPKLDSFEEGDDEDMNVDLDFDDGGSENEDSDFEEEHLSIKKRSRSSALQALFASAEEIGQLYGTQETAKERKQRLWEEKRALISSDRSVSKKRLNKASPLGFKRMHKGKHTAVNRSVRRPTKKSRRS
ncbi:CCAAT:enhancer binding protein zeta [Paragonimus heterotremus]|uniref:CCAAT:enhancer binding protein zeta n=1 Tax=Paragonimus heterotremus TaxID=100268 RepID=A0A8J4SR37_9TREM|nr:CCAAT:enhancer binding protein zeta [Paragonimus heterotremus]